MEVQPILVGHVLPRLDRNSRLAVRDAQWLVAELQQRENIFELRISAESAKSQADFRQRYGKLKQFLSTAIELDEPIQCSL